MYEQISLHTGIYFLREFYTSSTFQAQVILPNLLSVHLFKLPVPCNVNLLTAGPSQAKQRCKQHNSLRDDEHDDYDSIIAGDIIRFSGNKVASFIYNLVLPIWVHPLAAPHRVLTTQRANFRLFSFTSEQENDFFGTFSRR
jgi:hypothetical protein